MEGSTGCRWLFFLFNHTRIQPMAAYILWEYRGLAAVRGTRPTLALTARSDADDACRFQRAREDQDDIRGEGIPMAGRRLVIRTLFSRDSQDITRSRFPLVEIESGRWTGAMYVPTQRTYKTRRRTYRLSCSFVKPNPDAHRHPSKHSN